MDSVRRVVVHQSRLVNRASRILRHRNHVTVYQVRRSCKIAEFRQCRTQVDQFRQRARAQAGRPAMPRRGDQERHSGRVLKQRRLLPELVLAQVVAAIEPEDNQRAVP